MIRSNLCESEILQHSIYLNKYASTDKMPSTVLTASSEVRLLAKILGKLNLSLNVPRYKLGVWGEEE